jgi:hypothetical protein
MPPIPIDFIIEHLLDLRISWEDVGEGDNELILGCLRPETREVVLNERHRSIFGRHPGLERFSKAHEAGHADLFMLCGEADQLSFLTRGYKPLRRTATKGDVIAIEPRLRHLSPEARVEVFETVARWQRDRKASGEDSPLVRRAVDHYAAFLLMPRELVLFEARKRGLGTWADIVDLARAFIVSTTAMRIRLHELELLFGTDEAAHLVRTDPSLEAQGNLF